MENNYLISTNPAQGYKEIGRVAISTAADIEQAVNAARKAFPAWKILSVEERGKHLTQFRELLKKNLEAVARLQSQEMGKPFAQSMGECKSILSWLKFQIQNAPRILAPRLLDTGTDFQSHLHFEPYGVAAVISPWNYPTYQFVVNSAQALLSGNTVVLKHSEECPLTAQLLSSIMKDSGIPEGVFQVVHGDGRVGEQLTSKKVDLISFTGSSAVGKKIYKLAAEKFIPVVLEMGGSSPGIVFEDADLKSTCPSIYGERFSNCGQICCALKRLIVHESIFDAVVQNLKSIIETQVVGDPFAETTTIGPLSAKRQLELLESQIAAAKSEGATIVTGGNRVSGLEGAYFQPTLVTGITPNSSIWKEEVFGPVLPVLKFSDEAEAIKIANDTPYGLSAFVYTEDAARGARVAAQLESGQVSINGRSYFSEHAPFGGYKASGLGRNDGEMGYHSVTQMKVISRPL